MLRLVVEIILKFEMNLGTARKVSGYSLRQEAGKLLVELEHTMVFVPVLPYVYPPSQVTSTFPPSATRDSGEVLATNCIVGTEHTAGECTLR